MPTALIELSGRECSRSLLRESRLPLVTPPPGLKSCSSTFSNLELPAGWFPVAIVALLEDALSLGAVVRN